MSTPAIYTFKGDLQKGEPEIHFVYHSDGYPRGAAEKIPDLASVAVRLWAGEEVDLHSLNLPSIDDVQRLDTLGDTSRATPYRYEIEVVDGRPVRVRALRHDPVITDELQARLESARAAVKAVEAEMLAAWNAPTYTELGSGDLKIIRRLKGS